MGTSANTSFFEIRGNVKIETVSRRQSLAQYTIFTVRQRSKEQHSNLYSHMLVFVSMPRHTYSNKHYWLLLKSTTLRWKAVKRKFQGHVGFVDTSY